MGKIRVFKRSVRFTFRSRKRFLVFVSIFGIISTFVAFYVDSLDDLQTDRYLEQKGVVLQQDGEYKVTSDQGQNLLSDILALESSNDAIEIEDHSIFNYINLDGFLRVYSLDIDKPWNSNFAKPSLISKGRFPEKVNEVLVPEGSLQIRNSTVPGIRIKSKVVVGQKLIYEKDGIDSIELTIVGTFDTSNLQVKPDKVDRLWLFMDGSKFNELITLFGNETNDAFTYSISFIVPGNILSKNTHELVKALNDGIRPMINDESKNESYGLWEPQPDILPSKRAVEDGNRTMVNLGFVVIGGIILSTMFAYLISRFRRREIAILKAMGYSHASVRTSLIAEIITIAIMGFIVGLSIAQGLLYYLSEFNKFSLLRWQALGVAFITQVIISFPGMILVSMRVLGVSPSEAFRDK